MKNLRAAILGSNFTGSYIKKSVQHYVNVRLFNKNISYEFEGIYWGQQKLSCLEIEFEITLTNGGELNFDKYFLHLHVKKKVYPKFIQKSPPCEAYLFNFHQGKVMYL